MYCDISTVTSLGKVNTQENVTLTTDGDVESWNIWYRTVDTYCRYVKTFQSQKVSAYAQDIVQADTEP